MKTVRCELEIDIEPNKISDEALVKNVAYVLAVYLQSYSAYIGAPKICRVISKIDGETIGEDTPERASAW